MDNLLLTERLFFGMVLALIDYVSPTWFMVGCFAYAILGGIDADT